MSSRKGVGGRPRKPHLLLVGAGTKRDDRHGNRVGEDDEPIAEPPPPPEWLVWDYPSAVEHFRRFAATAVALRTMTEHDVDAMALCAVSFAEYLQAGRDIDAEGRCLPNANGGSARNPAYTTRNEVYKRVITMLAQFGLTPSGRAALIKPPGQSTQPTLGDFRRQK